MLLGAWKPQVVWAHTRAKIGCGATTKVHHERCPVMAAASVFVSLKPKLARINEAENKYLRCDLPSNVPFCD